MSLDRNEFRLGRTYPSLSVFFCGSEGPYHGGEDRGAYGGWDGRDWCSQVCIHTSETRTSPCFCPCRRRVGFRVLIHDLNLPCQTTLSGSNSRRNLRSRPTPVKVGRRRREKTFHVGGKGVLG